MDAEFEITPLLLVWPKSGIPGKYTLDEAKVGHYLLWDYISKSNTPHRKPPEAYLISECGCYACAYATHNFGQPFCDFCPLDWSHNRCLWCRSDGSIYDKWIENCENHYPKSKPISSELDCEARYLAKKIRDIPWKDGRSPLDVKMDEIHIVSIEQFKILFEGYKEAHKNG